MFIELTTNEGKTMVNTSNVAYIKPYQVETKKGLEVGTTIRFIKPTSANGSWALCVSETYEEVKRLIMEGK